QKVRSANIVKYTLLEAGSGFNSDLFSIARRLVRAGDERARPNAQRLREYSEANLETLQEQLFSAEEIYDQFEVVKLADGLTWMAGELGYNNPTVKKVLAGKAPVERARELVKGTKLKDVAVRKKLYEGGKEAIADSKDPMILLARAMDPESRAVRKTIET